MLLLQLLADGVVRGSFYSIVALSYALIYNGTRTFHIAHGAVFTCGAYAAYAGMVLLHWPWPFALLFALIVSSLLGLGLEVIVYAPLTRRRASLLIALLSSLGAYVVLVNFIAIAFGNDVKLVRPGLDSLVTLGPIRLTTIQLATVGTAAVVLPSILLVIRLTRWGKTIRALRDNTTLVSALGINVASVRRSLFAIGSALAGLAAVLTGLDVGVAPQMGMSPLLAAAVAVVVGGVGTFSGPIFGGMVLGLIQGAAIWQVSAEWTDAIAFAILISFQLLRPGGLMNRPRRLEEDLP
jgi:branched-chain amino acid transport system permease protein